MQTIIKPAFFVVSLDRNSQNDRMSGMKNFEKFGLRVPEILLPKKFDAKTWCAVACDQYTQDKNYWEQAQKTVLKIPKLRDCKYHLCDYDSKKKQEEKDKCAASMLFLTEGDSAAANMISARDPDYQAVFPLRGKPFNCQGKKKDTVYKNEELYFIMKSLGIEESMDDLRYGKIVIASDADVDGFHIRILLITFFLTFYQPLVLSDHLFILETPLFRVRNKKRNIYCYNERERAEAVSELGRGCEITRFKGLGEISPHEFGQFVDEGIRLLPVNIDNVKNIDSMLQFFMGDNTPERKDYIMRNCFFDLT